MAGMSDFSFDPFQVEEQDLAEQYKRALAKTLRQPQNVEGVGQNAMSYFNAAYDRASGDRELKDITSRRRAMSQQFEEGLINALRSQPQEIQDLVRHPATRAQGLDLMKKRQQMAMDQEELDTIRSRFAPQGGGGGGVLPQSSGAQAHQEAMAMAMSANPTIAARGKLMLEQMKGVNPINSMRVNPLTGEFEPIPGMDEAYRRQVGGREGAQAETELVPWPRGDGTVETITKAEYLRRKGMTPPGQGQGQGQGQFQGQGQTPPSVNMPAPGPQNAPAPVGAGPGGPPVPGPNMPATGLPSGPSPAPTGDPLLKMIPQLEGWNPQNPVNQRTGAAGPFQIMPQNVAELSRRAGRQLDPMNPQDGAMMAQQVLADARQRYGDNEAAVIAYYNGGRAAGDAVASGKNPPPETQAYLWRYAQMKARQEAPSAVPSPVSSAQAQGPASLQRPTSQWGETPDPAATDIYKKQMEGREGTYQKSQEKGSDIPDIETALGHMEDLTAKGTYTGTSALPMAIEGLVSTFTGGKSQRGQNTEQLNKYSSDLRASIIKQYGSGSGISDADLKATLDRIPNADMDPQTRLKLIGEIRQDLRSKEWRAPRVRAYVEQGVPLEEAQNRAYREYQQMVGRQNPTSAGSATKSALPASTRILGSEKDENSLWGAVKERAAALPGAILSAEGGEAMWDAYGNIIEGGKQLVGMGDREAWKQEAARQEQRKQESPAYEQAKIFHEVFNPTAAIGGTATSIPKVLGAAALQGALNPAESASAQAVNAVTSAAMAVPGVAASKFIPSTQLSKEVSGGGRGEELLSKFPSFKPTSAQMNPSPMESAVARGVGIADEAALDQAKAITRDLMKKAGMNGEQLSPKVIKEGQDAIGKQFDALLPKNKAVLVSSLDRDNLLNKVSNPDALNQLMGKQGAPSLQKLLGILTRDEFKPTPIAANELHQAWKELGQVADNPQVAGEIRQVLEGVIAKAIPQKDISKFKALNQKWGLAQDIERIYRGGAGEGVAEAAGYLKPSKIILEAGAGPVSSATDEAAQLINRFGVRDFRPEKAGGLDIGGMAKQVLEPIIGKAGYAMDVSAVRAPEGVKRVLEWLRAGTSRGGQNLFQGNE